MTGCTVVVGATGFVGRHVCEQLLAEGQPFRALARSERPAFIPDACYRRIPALPTAASLLEKALEGADAVIYLAARVHALDGDGLALLPEYRRQNVEAVRGVAQAALASGVRRFVFVSTVKVHGERTGSTPFRASDPVSPQGAYATSKREAEEALRDEFAGTRVALSIVRPPLVYGVGAAANFERLFRWVARGLPLPFGAVRNRRSLVGVRNLSDLLVHASQSDQSHTLLVSDGPPISTPDLVREIARALQRPARLLPVPAPVLGTTAALAGRAEWAQRLLGSLEVDATATGTALNWSPRFTMQEELSRMAAQLHRRRS